MIVWRSQNSSIARRKVELVRQLSSQANINKIGAGKWEDTVEVGFENGAGMASFGLSFPASAFCPSRRLITATSSASSFLNPTTLRYAVSTPSRESRSIHCRAERTPPTAESNVLVKLAWYGSEAVGNLVSVFRPSADNEAEEQEEAESFERPVPRQKAVEAIRKDFEKSYFVTGKMSMGIYEADCEFADPFVSFKGLKRFKQNVSNLGSFMEESSLKILDWQEHEDRIYAKWRFNCVLALPWRPILAASGSTEYYFDNDSGKISKHVEKWDISPADGVRQLFKPNPRRKAA